MPMPLDECLKRTDRGKRLDDPGNAAPKEFLPSINELVLLTPLVALAVFLAIPGAVITFTTPLADDETIAQMDDTKSVLSESDECEDVFDGNELGFEMVDCHESSSSIAQD
ncbi:hypothetical protein AAVH_15472 [Aphelenchoides avenae]|nr:hypothetical protein AAVH_15472 [Aphelenchus avenae]